MVMAPEGWPAVRTRYFVTRRASTGRLYRVKLDDELSNGGAHAQRALGAGFADGHRLCTEESRCHREDEAGVCGLASQARQNRPGDSRDAASRFAVEVAALAVA